MQRPIIFRTAALSVLALAAVSCGPSSGDVWTSDEDLLRYVPADTPYLLAKVAAPPDEVADKLESSFDAMLDLYQQAVLEGAAAGSADGDATADEGGSAREALAELLSLERLHEAGMTRDSTMVLYGAGLLPVLRIELAEGHMFESFLESMEAAADVEMTPATLDEQPYRYLELDDDARLVMRLLEREVVFSIVPTGLSEDLLASVLGVTMPDESIASSGALRDLADSYGFLPYYIGFFDVDGVAATFLEDASGINAELLALAEYDASALSDTCKMELREAAGVVPRAVLGYTALSDEGMTANTTFELREDIATELTGVAGRIPGLGTISDTLLAFGLGVDLSAAREFFASRVAAIEAEPYECELFTELQDSMLEGSRSFGQIPPLVYDFRGVFAVIDDIGQVDVGAGRMPDKLDARLLLAAENAPALAAMGAMMVPQLASLNLEPGGEPIRVELPQQPGVPVSEAYVALTQDTIAAAVGENAEERLSEVLAAPSSEQQSTFLTLDMDVARYYELLGSSMLPMGTSTADLPPELDEAMVDTLAGIYARQRVDVLFTERGIEMPVAVTFPE